MESNLISIELDDPSRSYTAGQILNGRVILTSKKPRKLKEVAVYVKGVCSVYWRNGALGKAQGECSATDYCANLKIVLAGGGKGFVELSKLVEVYQFRFKLPADLPSSFAISTGKVEYAVIAEATNFSIINRYHKATLPITVSGVYDLNIHKEDCIPQECSMVKGSNKLSGRRGLVSFVLRLPQRSGFTCGETLDFYADIVNSSNQNVLGVKACLQQVTTFNAFGAKKTVKETVAEVEGSGIECNENVRWRPGTLIIPTVPPTGLGGKSPAIDVQYLLYFEMYTFGLGNNLFGTVPVTIGTVPLVPEFNEVQNTRTGSQRCQATPPADLPPTYSSIFPDVYK